MLAEVSKGMMWQFTGTINPKETAAKAFALGITSCLEFTTPSVTRVKATTLGSPRHELNAAGIPDDLIKQSPCTNLLHKKETSHFYIKKKLLLKSQLFGIFQYSHLNLIPSHAVVAKRRAVP